MISRVNSDTHVEMVRTLGLRWGAVKITGDRPEDKLRIGMIWRQTHRIEDSKIKGYCRYN